MKDLTNDQGQNITKKWANQNMLFDMLHYKEVNGELSPDRHKLEGQSMSL